jgi:hypothetical protein
MQYARLHLLKIDEYTFVTVNYNIMSNQKRKSSLSKGKALKSNKIINEVGSLGHGAIF